MQTQTNLKHLKHELTNMKLESATEYKILQFWREHEPKKVEELLTKQMLRQALTQMADDLLDLQTSLEKTEHLNPVLARMEAWNRLMRIEEDAAEEAEAFGMTVEEYKSRM